MGNADVTALNRDDDLIADGAINPYGITGWVDVSKQRTVMG